MEFDNFRQLPLRACVLLIVVLITVSTRVDLTTASARYPPSRKKLELQTAREVTKRANFDPVVLLSCRAEVYVLLIFLVRFPWSVSLVVELSCTSLFLPCVSKLLLPCWASLQHHH